MLSAGPSPHEGAEAIPAPGAGRVDAAGVVWAQRGPSLGHKKEAAFISNDTDEPGGHYAKWDEASCEDKPCMNSRL